MRGDAKTCQTARASARAVLGKVAQESSARLVTAGALTPAVPEKGMGMSWPAFHGLNKSLISSMFMNYRTAIQ
jgi:hypothetical protein